MINRLLVKSTVFTALMSGAVAVSAQDAGHLSGDLQLNANFFQRDTSIGAANNPLYDNLLSGSEAWLSLRYNIKGFTAFLRVDAFANSNLQNPVAGMTGFGVGAWSLSKEFNKLTITGGYIYDQIGNGIIFRAYEDRGMLIDNALAGMHLKYALTDKINVKGFVGQQKNAFELYKPVIKGFAADGNFTIKDKVFLSPGIGILNRTLDKSDVDMVVNNINSLPLEERFEPVYNTYAFTFFNNLSAGAFSWDLEASYKTKEAINDYYGRLMDKNGSVFFTSLNYAKRGIAVNLMGKRTENFVLRTSPNQTLANSGMLNWQPVIAQIRPQRLISRYVPASQDLTEISYIANVDLMPSDDYNFNVSYTHINTLDGMKLFREAVVEANMRSIPKTIIDLGVHYMQYNQEYYQNKPGYAMVNAVTPYAEVTYSFTDVKSGKFSLQYMDTKQDFGSWLYAAIEFSVASKWSVAISDMYNSAPTKLSTSARHYYNVYTSYTSGAHRFSIAYVKQVEGINCTGGVCRYEPAFNGVRVGITSSF